MTPPPSPYAPPQAPWGARPPPKKGTSGWIIALAIVGGVVFLGIAVVVVGVVAFLKSDVGQTTIKVVGATKHLTEKGMSAPGAAQLRSHGCDQALIWNMTDFDELMQAFDASAPSSTTSRDDVMVMCQVQGMHPPPACDDVAANYVSAIGGSASGEITVIVQQQGNNHPICENRYDPSGGYIGATGAGAPPPTF